MNLPKLYSRSNDLQMTQNEYLLDKYFKYLQLGGAETVLDVGCAIGDTTKHLLLPLLPTNIKCLTGCDINDKMLDFANLHNGDEKIKYINLDICDVLVKWGCYDAIFSFFCLHWVKCLRSAFANLHTLLNPGGSMLISYIVESDVYTRYRHLYKMPKWTRYMEGIEYVIPSTSNCEDIEDITKNMLINAGFKIQICDVLERKYVFNTNEEFLGFLKSINAFITKIPVNQHEEYLSDFANSINGSEKVNEYKIIVIVARRDSKRNSMF